MAYEPPDFYEFEVSPDLYPPYPPLNRSGSGNISTQSPPSPFGGPLGENLKAVLKAALFEADVKTALLAIAAVIFIFLISKDAHKAFTRRAHWIPCDFLVLSAFSIQLLNLLTAQNEAMGSSPNMKISIKSANTPDAKSTPWEDILSTRNSRIILSIFAAYVMPAMADRGLEHSWVRWVALVITVTYKSSRKDLDILYFVVLILLLACATIAGRSIERIVSKKISLLLSSEKDFCGGLAEKTQEAHHRPHRHSCWRTVKIAVNRADHHDLHHDHDRSCLQTVKEAVLRAGKGDENEHHSCWRTVEAAVLRVKKRQENDHSCWRTVEDELVRGDEHHRRHCHYCWRTVEDAVLKAWIIVRAYSIQPVIARSPLTTAVVVIVKIQIIITIVGVVAKKVSVHDPFRFVATILQFVFILIAWLLVTLRWATGVAYYRRRQNASWLSVLWIEDFWTRSLKELQQARELRRRAKPCPWGELRPRGDPTPLEERRRRGETPLQRAQLLDTKIEQLVAKEQTTSILPSEVLYALIGLQCLLVSFCKACWLASLMIFHNKLMGKLLSYKFRKHIMYVFEDYPKYKKILEDVQMLGDTPESLWVANHTSIKKAKNLIIQGNQDAEYKCKDLVDFLSIKRTGNGLGLSCLDQSGKKSPFQRTQQAQEENDVEKQQPRGAENGLLAVEEHFTDVSKKSWKMAAVSLLSIIVRLSPIYKKHSSTSHVFPPRAVEDCLKAYSQAWEIIDFVEMADTDADEIISEAADKYFQALQKKVDQGGFPESNSVRAALEELKTECESKMESLEQECELADKGKKEKGGGRPNRWKGNDSIDWIAAASGSAVYNLCNSIECNDRTDVTELLKELESSLADIINECLEKVQHLLLLNSRKWALNRDEKSLGKALYTAGKAKIIMKKLEVNNV